MDGRVLDGPNFTVGFLIDRQLRLISPGANRLLPSCTQELVSRAATAAGLPLAEGTVHIDEVQGAVAGFAMSATRHVLPLGAIDGRELSAQEPLIRSLQEAYWRLLDGEVQAAVAGS